MIIYYLHGKLIYCKGRNLYIANMLIFFTNSRSDCIWFSWTSYTQWPRHKTDFGNCCMLHMATKNCEKHFFLSSQKRHFLVGGTTSIMVLYWVKGGGIYKAQWDKKCKKYVGISIIIPLFIWSKKKSVNLIPERRHIFFRY